MNKLYKDGTFTGTSKGNSGQITVSVDVKDSKIDQITIVEHTESAGISDAAFARVTQAIIDQQTTKVDAVTGATESSKAVMEATSEALGETNQASEISSTEVAVHATTSDKNQPKVENGYQSWLEKPAKIDKTIQTELLIVGGGISGLACAVQGRLSGLEVTLIEKNGFLGGNGSGVEGILGVGSSMQKEAEIKLDPVEVIDAEQSQAQYRTDGSLWTELVYSSADNIEWLLEQGVKLTHVDNYGGTGAFDTFHWFKGGHGSTGYTPFMEERANELGVNVKKDTAAIGIIEEDGTIKGMYVKSPEGIIEIQAKAVVLSTGGIGGNKELIAKQGWKTENMLLTGMPGSTGDAYQMAMAVGAGDSIRYSCQLLMNYIQAFPHDASPLYADPLNGMLGFGSGGPMLWVNQYGKRFVNENVFAQNMMYQSMAIGANKVSYIIFNQAIFDKFAEDKNIENAQRILEDSVKTNKGNSLFKGYSIEELAVAVNLPVDKLVETVNHYNELAKAGKDIDFGKESELMVAIQEGPLYIARLDFNYLVGIGGIRSNEEFEVINEEFEPVKGLYVTGMDTAEQYRNLYTINVPGSACAHTVHSGRRAAMNATKYIKG